MIKVRKGQAPGKLSRDQFHDHFRQSYIDPAFDAERDAIERLEQIAWSNYTESRKSPVTRKAGPEFADVEYDLRWNGWKRVRSFAMPLPNKRVPAPSPGY